MQIQKIIENLGYTAKETKVYLAALSLGEAHISDIAEKVKMPHSSVQVIAGKLNRKGLLNFYVMRRYKYWVAANPERLLDTLKKREALVQEALPRLAAIKKATWGKRGKKNSLDADMNVFRVMANDSRQPVLIADETIEIVYVNEAWEKQFGYLLEEVRGENPRILKSGKTLDDVYKRMWTALKSEKMFQTDEIIDKRKDGTFFNILTTIFPVRHNGRLFYIQILDDIMEKKRVEALKQKFVSGGV